MISIVLKRRVDADCLNNYIAFLNTGTYFYVNIVNLNSYLLPDGLWVLTTSVNLAIAPFGNDFM